MTLFGRELLAGIAVQQSLPPRGMCRLRDVGLVGTSALMCNSAGRGLFVAVQHRAGVEPHLC
jgi:hypothetical protein